MESYRAPEPQVLSLAGLRGGNRSVVACGADLKSRFSILSGDEYRVSADYGDLAAPDNYERFTSDLRTAARRYCPDPDVVAFDLHPLYYSGRAAELFPAAARVGVQHHHAHIAGVLAQYREEREVIGVSFDGTGYGDDGNLWGGEFLVVSRYGWRRAGRLGYLSMPGGEAAVRQPWRLAFALLREYHVGQPPADLPPLLVRDKRDYLVLESLLARGISMPRTSSCGRLFDAVSSLLGVTQVVSFEGEAAINLEKAAADRTDEGWYPFEITGERGVLVAGYRTFLAALLDDLRAGTPRGTAAARFHNSVARLIVDMAERIRKETGFNSVALSGGVFQNRLLRGRAMEWLAREGFEVLETPAVPVSDLGICVGQTFAALWRLK